MSTHPTFLLCVDGRPMAWQIADRVFPYVAGGADGDDPPADPPADPPPGDDPPADPPADEPKKLELTQDELDAIIAREKGKATRAAESAAKQAADRAKMDEAERLKAEKADAEAAAAATVAKAQGRVIAAEAKIVAAAEGVDPKRVDRFLRTLDLSAVEVDDEGEPDTAAIKKLIAEGLKDLPEFKGSAKPGPSSGDHGRPADQQRPSSLGAAVDERLAATG